MISLGSLSPGDRLGQIDLAEYFKVSRVPLREALKLLAAEGVVTHDVNRGFFVPPLSSDEARQLYRLRQFVEGEVLATVKWPDQPVLIEMEKAVDEIERLQRSRRRAQWALAHRRFRESVFALSEEKFLVNEALRLWSLADRYRSLLAAVPHPSTEGGGSTDRHLLDALKSRNRQHLLTVFETDRGKIAASLMQMLKLRGV